MLLRGAPHGEHDQLFAVGEHIVDFACTKVRLVVEVDGTYREERARHDAARDRALGKLGWHVVRVGEHEVFGALDGVVARIVACALRGREARVTR